MPVHPMMPVGPVGSGPMPSSSSSSSAVLGWPKAGQQSGQNYTGKYLTSNNILNVTVNRTINL